MRVACTEERFLEDIDRHEMRILRDEDLYRHLRFKRQNSGTYYFDIITWPGHLCYTGDMGTFVFKRLPDMFEFFRWEEQSLSHSEKRLHINLDYWAEKVISYDKYSPVEEYSFELLQEVVEEWLSSWCESYPEKATEMREDFKNCVNLFEDYSESRIREEFYNYDFEGHDVFQDFHEISLTTYTTRFIWCCYGLAWAIQVYDVHVSSQESEKITNG